MVVDGVPGGEEGAMFVKTIIKAILVNDGIETCTIGFLPRHVIHRGTTTINRFMGKFAQIIELYDLCDDSMAKKNKSSRNQGMASFHMLNNIQEGE